LGVIITFHKNIYENKKIQICIGDRKRREQDKKKKIAVSQQTTTKKRKGNKYYKTSGIVKSKGIRARVTELLAKRKREKKRI
jgi:hypothetical protein